MKRNLFNAIVILVIINIMTVTIFIIFAKLNLFQGLILLAQIIFLFHRKFIHTLLNLFKLYHQLDPIAFLILYQLFFLHPISRFILQLLHLFHYLLINFINLQSLKLFIPFLFHY